MKSTLLSFLVLGFVILSPSHPRVYAAPVMPLRFAGEEMLLSQLLHAHGVRARCLYLSELAKSLDISSGLIGVGIGGWGLAEGGGVYPLTDGDDIKMLAKLATISQDLNEARYDTTSFSVVLGTDSDRTTEVLGIEPEEALRLKSLYGFVWRADELLSPSLWRGGEALLAAYQDDFPDFAQKLQATRTLHLQQYEREKVQEHQASQDKLSFLQKIFAKPTEKEPTTPPTPVTLEVEQQNTIENNGPLSEARQELVALWQQKLSQVLDLDLNLVAVANDNQHFGWHIPELRGIIQARPSTDTTQAKQREEASRINALAQVLLAVQLSFAQGETPTVATVQSSVGFDGDEEALSNYILTLAFAQAVAEQVPASNMHDEHLLNKVEQLLAEYGQLFGKFQLSRMQAALSRWRAWNNEFKSRLRGKKAREGEGGEEE